MTEVLLGAILGFLVGMYLGGQAAMAPFEGEYDRAVHEWNAQHKYKPKEAEK